MSAEFRRTLAALAALLMLTSAAAPASAISIANEARSNVVFDAMVMRPLGLGAFLMGSALFTISLPLLAVSRPEDIGTPWRILVAAPAKYVWGDPLGEH